MTFWIVLLLSIVGALVLIVVGLDAWQDRPRGVSPADWQRVSEERERERLNRVLGKTR